MIFPNQKDFSGSGFRKANTKVHIWHASLEQPAEVVRKLEAVLSNEERQRAERFRYEEHRRSFIVGRGILRNLLHGYTNIRPDRVQFAYNPSGKPFLAGGRTVPELHFNLSHAGRLVLYAFSWGRHVGIDVEWIHPMEDMDLVARMNFSPREFIKYQRLDKQERVQAFYNCWTRKEAFIKAIGDGLSFPLQEFEVSLEPGAPAELITLRGSNEEAGHWTLHDLKTQDGYAGALAVEGKDHSLSHKEWSGA